MEMTIDGDYQQRPKTQCTVSILTSVACCLHSHSWPSFSKKRRKRRRSFTCCTWLKRPSGNIVVGSAFGCSVTTERLENSSGEKQNNYRSIQVHQIIYPGNTRLIMVILRATFRAVIVWNYSQNEL